MLCKSRCQSLAQSCCHQPRQGASRTLGNRRRLLGVAGYQRDPSRPQAATAGVVRVQEQLKALKETLEKTGASKLDVSELGGKVDALGKGLFKLEVELSQLKGEIVGGVGVQGVGLKGQVVEVKGQLDKLGAEVTGQRNLLLFLFVVLVVLADWQNGLDKVKILFDLSKGIM